MKTPLWTIHIREPLRNSTLPHKEELVKLVRDAYCLIGDPADPTSQDPGVSRFGGFPDLPAEIEWPSWRGRPQLFVAQINLQDLPTVADRSLLPEQGILYFFYDSARETTGTDRSEKESFAVYFVDQVENVGKPRRSPPDLRKEDILLPSRIQFDVEESQPGWQHPFLERLGLTWDDQFEYLDVINAEHIIDEEHRMLGYPVAIQAPVATVCQAVSMEDGEVDRERQKAIWDEAKDAVDEWELLLQVKSDHTIGIYWPPDCGVLYYMIRRSDLLARRFDRVWMIKQFS